MFTLGPFGFVNPWLLAALLALPIAALVAIRPVIVQVF